MKKRFNVYSKLIMAVACIFGATAVFILRDDQIGSQGAVDDSSQLSSSTRQEGSLNSSQPNSEILSLEVTEISNATDILDLEVESKFSFRAGSSGKDDIVVLSVTGVSQNPTFTQVQGRGQDGAVAIITLTPTLTNILLKTSTNIFEYIGDEFDGTLSQIARLDLSDDIHESKPLAIPIENTLEARKVMER
jgi:hypothetical protein